ncbi:flavodoxin family protein [Desulfovibrio psychrotolerans]|uniref:FMN reductase n=1 Tax=Desulfovibrio psychrotolerans TaxID=415242 RepID=A0A7J0BXQ5_9BACT|nr:flavodoxin family protein [Desulfovibrio psychrotolerans]GFM38478.1 FMN reductase [Desulfovibrio psychrotolerans]
MKVVAFNGSPREGGNTEHLIKAVFVPLEEAGVETELVRIGGTGLRGCIACMKCRERKDGKCAIKNDDLNDYVEKMRQADGILLGSPTYFTDVTAEMQALIDRAGFVTLGNGAQLRRKVGAAVVAVRRGGATHVFDTMNHFFQISQMIVPGSTYWNMGYGLGPGQVTADEEGMNNMRNLGETMAWLMKAIEGR